MEIKFWCLLIRRCLLVPTQHVYMEMHCNKKKTIWIVVNYVLFFSLSFFNENDIYANSVYWKHILIVNTFFRCCCSVVAIWLYILYSLCIVELKYTVIKTRCKVFRLHHFLLIQLVFVCSLSHSQPLIWNAKWIMAHCFVCVFDFNFFPFGALYGQPYSAFDRSEFNSTELGQKYNNHF